jgi:hypothetical protein
VIISSNSGEKRGLREYLVISFHLIEKKTELSKQEFLQVMRKVCNSFKLEQYNAEPKYMHN